MEAEIDLKEIYMIAATRIDVDYLQFLNLLKIAVAVGCHRFTATKTSPDNNNKRGVWCRIYIQCVCTISRWPGMMDTSWSIIGIVALLFTSIAAEYDITWFARGLIIHNKSLRWQLTMSV